MSMEPGLSPIALHHRLEAIWRTPPGWGRLSAVNHTVVGRRFIVTAFVFFIIGGILAMLLRIQLARPESPFLGPEIYNQIFTMHGSVMMFLFVIPLIEGIAIYMLPKILGARDLAFPRLSAYGYWCYLFGGSLLVGSLLLGLAPDSGWFMYTPLSSRPFSPGINSDIWLIGVTFVEVSAIAAAVEFAVTVLKVRAGGMALDRMPLLAWYLLVTAMMMIGGFPPLILGSVLLEVERALDWPFFDPQRGGSPLLWQHLFWLFGHPEVYIIFLPAAGVISTILPVFARRPIVGYVWLVCAIIALGFLSFGLWVHHMFTTGIPHLSLAFFSAASTLVTVPTAVQIFAWLATLITGRPELKLPMLYVLGFFFVFVAGGLTGVMVAVVPFDWQVHDTHFVVAHLHYVLVGGFVFPMLGAAYYWLPHLSGRTPVYHLGQVAFWLIFIGFNLTFLIMHLTGLLGMPRRVFTYMPGFGWDWPNLVSSFGSFIMMLGFATFAVDLVLQCIFGEKVRRNPWGAGTLEWAMPIPPSSYAFASLPRVSSPDPLYKLPRLPAELAAGRGYLGRANQRRMETLCVDMVSGEPDQVLIYPNTTYLPLLTALSTGLFFLSILFSLYWLTPFAMVIILACGVRWVWTIGSKSDPVPEPIGLGAKAIAHYGSPSSPSWWGVVFLLVANGVFFASLVFGYLFLFTAAPSWPPADFLATNWLSAGAVAFGLIGSAIASQAARRQNERGQNGRETLMLLSAVATLLALGGLAVPTGELLERASDHAYFATGAALALYAATMAIIGLVMVLYAVARSRQGFVSAVRNMDMRVPNLWQLYAAATGLAVLALLYGPSLVVR